MEAAPAPDVIVLLSYTKLDGGNVCYTVSCPDHDAYQALPQTIRTLNGDRLAGKTGWNSDTGVAYYRTDAMMAKVV